MPTVVLAAGGSLETAMLPQRLLYLRADYGVEVRAAVSAGALEFVTRTALMGVTGSFVYEPDTRFAPGSAVPVHLSLADADLLVLHPATARVLSQCALGEVTCPVTRLFAFSAKDRILVAPAIHPRMDRRIYEPHVARLRDLGCEVLGGPDLWATWHDAETRIVARLGLTKKTRTGDVLLDEL
ncbi:MAG: hypothetical protein KIT84_36570 [Labilithrix sp.]|nr:hypothetical protein [Labilithrix sp.]MCW5816571.1 hypothetical protein [Labilithrix sp.]